MGWLNPLPCPLSLEHEHLQSLHEWPQRAPPPPVRSLSLDPVVTPAPSSACERRNDLRPECSRPAAPPGAGGPRPPLPPAPPPPPPPPRGPPPPYRRPARDPPAPPSPHPQRPRR